MDDQTLEKIWENLKNSGYTPKKYKLEPINIMTDKAPAGTFDNIYCLQLIDKTYHRKFDTVSRNWKPVLFIRNNLFFGPSPELFTRLIEEIKYFERPKDFNAGLILQLHSFSMNFYKSVSIRLPPFKEYDNCVQGDQNELIIKGEVQRGTWKKYRAGRFTTRIERGKKAVFSSSI